MALKLVRRDGGRVNAYEDRVGFGFAFGGQDGVIKDILNEFSADTSSAVQLKIKSGMAVIQGNQILLDEDYVLPLAPVTGGNQKYYNIFVFVEMSQPVYEEGKLLNGKATIGYQVADNNYTSFFVSQNLNKYPNGSAYLPLYRFKLTSSGIQDFTNVFTFIKSTAERLDESLGREIMLSDVNVSSSDYSDRATLTFRFYEPNASNNYGHFIIFTDLRIKHSNGEIEAEYRYAVSNTLLRRRLAGSMTQYNALTQAFILPQMTIGSEHSTYKGLFYIDWDNAAGEDGLIRIRAILNNSLPAGDVLTFRYYTIYKLNDLGA